MSGPVMFNDPPVRTEAMLALFRTVQRRLLLLTAAAAVLGSAAGLLVGALPGVWGALLAAALGLAFTFATVGTLRFLAGRGPELLQVVLIGGLLIKMVLVVVVLLWLRTEDFYHRGVFFLTLVVVVLGAVIIEMHAVATARIPAVEPGATGVTSVTSPGAGAATSTPGTTHRRDNAGADEPPSASGPDQSTKPG